MRLTRIQGAEGDKKGNKNPHRKLGEQAGGASSKRQAEGTIRNLGEDPTRGQNHRRWGRTRLQKEVRGQQGQRCLMGQRG